MSAKHFAPARATKPAEVAPQVGAEAHVDAEIHAGTAASTGAGAHASTAAHVGTAASAGASGTAGAATDKRGARETRSNSALPANARPSSGARSRRGLITPVAITLLIVFAAQGILLVSIRPALRVAALAFASLASVAGVWACAWRARGDRKRANALMQRVFCVALVGLSLLYCAFFPPRTVPDENIHYSAAYSYANHLDPTTGQYEVRTEDLEFIRDPVVYNQEFTSDFWEWRKGGVPVFATHARKAEDPSFAHDVDFGADAPQLRLFAALGILLGRLLNLSGAITFYLGRLFNLLPCVALILLAVRLLPVGRNIMMTISLLPMTLHLLGSLSYDATIIALAFLLISLLLRAMLGTGAISRRLEIACVVMAVLLAPCKIVYTVLALLACAVPSERFGSRREAWLWRGGMLLLPLLAVLVMRMGKLLVMAGVSGAANKAARRSSTESLYTLGDVLANPLAPIGMLVRTLCRHADFYSSSMVGGSLAWFQQNIEAYRVQVIGLVGVLCLSGLKAADDARVLGRRLRAVCLAVFALGVFAVFFSMILIWTVAGASIIQGVQGRYFIPLLPLLLIGLRGRTIVVHGDLAPVLLAALAGFNCIYLAQIAFVVLGGAV